MKFFTYLGSARVSTISTYFWLISWNGFRLRNVQLSSSPGMLPRVSTSRSTSTSEIHRLNKLSGVWKSTGVTMVTRFLTFSVWVAA